MALLKSILKLVIHRGAFYLLYVVKAQICKLYLF